jgi:hypothetical protein
MVEMSKRPRRSNLGKRAVAGARQIPRHFDCYVMVLTSKRAGLAADRAYVCPPLGNVLSIHPSMIEAIHSLPSKFSPTTYL